MSVDVLIMFITWEVCPTRSHRCTVCTAKVFPLANKFIQHIWCCRLLNYHYSARWIPQVIGSGRSGVRQLAWRHIMYWLWRTKHMLVKKKISTVCGSLFRVTFCVFLATSVFIESHSAFRYIVSTKCTETFFSALLILCWFIPRLLRDWWRPALSIIILNASTFS